LKFGNILKTQTYKNQFRTEGGNAASPEHLTFFATKIKQFESVFLHCLKIVQFAKKTENCSTAAAETLPFQPCTTHAVEISLSLFSHKDTNSPSLPPSQSAAPMSEGAGSFMKFKCFLKLPDSELSKSTKTVRPSTFSQENNFVLTFQFDLNA
jgi:hypothetical protein